MTCPQMYCLEFLKRKIKEQNNKVTSGPSLNAFWYDAEGSAEKEHLWHTVLLPENREVSNVAKQTWRKSCHHQKSSYVGSTERPRTAKSCKPYTLWVSHSSTAENKYSYTFFIPLPIKQANIVITILGFTSTRSSGRAYTLAPILLATDTAYLEQE